MSLVVSIATRAQHSAISNLPLPNTQQFLLSSYCESDMVLGTGHKVKITLPSGKSLQLALSSTPLGSFRRLACISEVSSESISHSMEEFTEPLPTRGWNIGSLV